MDHIQLLISSSLILYNISRDLAISRETPDDDGEEEMQEELYQDALDQIAIPAEEFDENDRSAVRRKIVTKLFLAEHDDWYVNNRD